MNWKSRAGVKVKHSIRRERGTRDVGKEYFQVHKGDERVLESTAPQTEVVMETPLVSRQLDFGNWIAARLDATRAAPKPQNEVRHHTCLPPLLCPEVKAYNTIRRLERDLISKVRIYPARKPKSKRVRIFPLWRYSAHDSSCRTK